MGTVCPVCIWYGQGNVNELQLQIQRKTKPFPCGLCVNVDTVCLFFALCSVYEVVFHKAKDEGTWTKEGPFLQLAYQKPFPLIPLTKGELSYLGKQTNQQTHKALWFPGWAGMNASDLGNGLNVFKCKNTAGQRSQPRVQFSVLNPS